jgi:hypothetical protein
VSQLRIRDETLRHAATLPVLGIPVRVRSDAPEVIAAFEDAFGFCRPLFDRPELVGSEAVEGRIVVHDGDEGGAEPPAVRYRLVDPQRLICWTPGSVCAGDARRREFHGWVTRALLADRVHFRIAILESLVLSIVTWMDRVPVHGSVLAGGGAALLLTGPSGTGKSTLTYAAARAGTCVLTDEIVFAQRAPARAWGMPRVVNLPSDGTRFFPELASAPRRLLPNGKQKIPVELEALGAVPTLPLVERIGVCVLERGQPGAGVRVAELPADEVVRVMLDDLEPGFHLFEDRLPAIVREWAGAGAWRLSVDGHPADAVPVVRELLEDVARR